MNVRVLMVKYLEGEHIKVVHFNKERDAAQYATDIKRGIRSTNAPMTVYRDGNVVVVYDGKLPDGMELRIERQ